MLRRKHSYLRIVPTAGNDLAVADMLRRDISDVKANTCYLKQKTLPPQIILLILQPDDSLKQLHSLVQHEDIVPPKKTINTRYSQNLVMINSISELLKFGMM